MIQCELVIVGGGPAGMAPILRAARLGFLDELLKAGVMMIEADEVQIVDPITSSLSHTVQIS